MTDRWTGSSDKPSHALAVSVGGFIREYVFGRRTLWRETAECALGGSGHPLLCASAVPFYMQQQQEQDRPVRFAELYELDENESRSGLVHRASTSGAAKPTALPATVFIQVSATGSSRWTDELGSEPGPVDCAVQLGVGQQQPRVKHELAPVSRSKDRSWIRHGCIAVFVLGLMAAAVLVPVSQIIGFNKKLPARYKVLQPPADSHRIIFAFNGTKVLPVADALLPAELAAAVLQWTVLASSGVHVASFNSRPAMQQATALLANATGLKYAVADFRLLQDSVVSSMVDPEKLSDLSRMPTRQLLQQQKHSLDNGVSEAAVAAGRDRSSSSNSYRAAQASKLLATHRQRLAQRKAKRRQLLLEQPVLASLGLPATARGLLEEQRQHWLPAAEAQLQAPTAGQRPRPTRPTRCDSGSSLSWQRLPAPNPAPGTNHDRNSMQGSGVANYSGVGSYSGAGNHSYSSSWANSYACGTGTEHSTSHASTARQGASRLPGGQHHHQRKLQQLPVPTKAQPQPQQAQAKQHVQKGGQGVAWHLTAAGLDVKQAWSKTHGLDEVVVAVIDSGVELSHSGLGPSLWANAGEVAGDGLDNDGNGYVDDVMGWDFGGSCADAACTSCTPGPDPTDMTGWGTHAAAVIAAQPEVASGTAGIAPGVRVMALKVADCRADMQLGTWRVQAELGSTADGSRSSSSTAAGTGGSSSSSTQLNGHGAAAPVLLASAAVQAFDYALLHGAHVVLAGWGAGSILDSSSSSGSESADSASTTANASISTVASQQPPDCVLGVAAVTQDPSSSSSRSACLAAVQRLLFLDVLHPLEQAGVLVITMHPDDSESAATTSSGSGGGGGGFAGAAAAAGDAATSPMPCSLGLEVSNVLCVASAPHDAATSQSLAADVAPAVFFENLISDLDNGAAPPLASTTGSSNSSGSAASSRSTNYTDSNGSGNATAHYSNAPDADDDAAPDQETNTITSLGGAFVIAEAGASRTLLLAASPVALLAPGKHIMAGWAWASHAAVSGGAAAAAVAAGAAALTWSNLGQALGAEASGAAAHEGLGQLVKQMLVDSGSRRSKGAASSGGVRGHESSNRGLTSPMVGSHAETVLGGRSSSSGAGPRAGQPELDLLQAQQLSSAYTGPLHLKPAQLAAAVTAASSSLSFSWHISSARSGPYDTQAMAFVARKALSSLAPFPLSDWEFYGDTSLVEVEGFVEVQDPGNYSLAVGSKDRFIVWLQDKWLAMSVVGGAGPNLGLDARAWTAGVLFTQPGLYKLRIIIYVPSLSAFDLKWLPPGATAYSHIPRFVSFGRTQPLPLQLADQISGRMLAHRSSGSSRQGVPGSGAGSMISTELSSSSPAASASDNVPHPSVAASPVIADSGQPVTTSSEDAAGSADVHSSSTEPPQHSSSYLSHDKPAYQSAYYDASTPLAEPQQQQQQQQQYGNSDLYGSSSGGSSSGGSSQGSSFGSFLNALFGSLGFRFERGNGQVELPATPSSSNTQQPAAAAAAATGSSSITDFAGIEGAEAQQQQRRRTRKQQRLLQATEWMTDVFSRQSAVAPVPGVFSVAVTLDEPWEYRTIIPSLRYLNLQLTGILPGPGLEVASGYELQQQLLGYVDASDGRSGYGVIQGWLDWQDLNPAAMEWLQTLSSSSSSSSSSDSSSAGLSSAFGSQVLGIAGVQFELLCGNQAGPHGCALHIDGMVVAGSIGEPSTSACVVPARRLITKSSSDAAAAEQLLHLELLFATDAVREATFAVRSRPCLLTAAGGSELPLGSDGSYAALVPAAGASSLGLKLAEVAAAAAAGGSSGSSSSSVEGYMHGMLCTVRATVPAQVTGAAGSTSTSSRQLEKVAVLTAQQLQQAAASANDAAVAEAAAAAAAAVAASDTAAGASDTAAAANDTAAAGSSAGAAHDSHLRATAEVVASVPGISVQQLAPEWVTTLPQDTSYGLTCGCYWNGSWFGGVSVGVGAGSTGTASLYLAGWPVDVQSVLPQYGPSDIEVNDYSSWQQRQQLASGSAVADPVHWRAAKGGLAGGNINGLGLGDLSDPAVMAQVGYRPNMLTGGSLFNLGTLTGLYAYEVPRRGGHAQLLVLQAEGLSAAGRVVVVADVAGATELKASDSARPFAALKAGWMPGEWNAWLPA